MAKLAIRRKYEQETNNNYTSSNSGCSCLIYGLVQGRNDAKMGLSLPAGFVSLEDEITSSEGALSYVFWESQISFLDPKGTCIYQTSVKNDSFIVKYKGKYFISESKYNEMLEAVKNIKE
jgi:hypothetical protein